MRGFVWFRLLFDAHRQSFCSVALPYMAALIVNFICHSSPYLSLPPALLQITLEEHRREVKCFTAISRMENQRLLSNAVGGPASRCSIRDGPCPRPSGDSQSCSQYQRCICARHTNIQLKENLSGLKVIAKVTSNSIA